uniref:Centromere/kinetochore protein zw10 homolog n=1 Tax=Myripristis murdjan TaxID=586833 RepID=A0A667YUH0_9TELE
WTSPVTLIAFKEEVCDTINKRYNEFLPCLQGSEELMGQVDELSKEIDTLKTCIDSEVRLKLDVIINKLKFRYYLFDYLSSIYLKIAMEDFNKAVLEKKYVSAAEQLQRAKASVESLKDWKSSELPLLRALSSELTVQRENFIYILGDEWKRLAIWKLPSSKGKSLQTLYRVSAFLCLLPSKHVCIVSSSTANPVMADCHPSGQILLKNMLKPLVMYPSLSVKVTEQDDATSLALQCLEESSEERSTPSQVYSKLILVLKTLHSNLLDVSIGDKKLSAVLGELIWEEISQCIIHECLLYSIPTNSSQLEKYNTVIKETEEFEKSLKEMQYLHGDSTDLLKYARDVNCHFASKKCKDVIVAARKLMTSKMHNTVKITPNTNVTLPKLPVPSSEVRVSQEARKEEVMLDNVKQLAAGTLSLPACRISESVQQLMELVLNTLCEAVGSSPQCALQLFFTVRNIFQLFYDVVPTYHKESLLKFPHLAAIQHNNCMYLAHHLLTLGHQFRPHLPPPLSEGIATFVDMVPGFRKLGAQCFLTQLNVQRAELLERLSTARNFSNLDDEENYIAASKAVRQVIHQLKQLGTVWQDVLPVSIYCKAMGSLLNTAITEVISKIMMLEDISSEDGEHLHTLCQTIIEEGPLVFIPLAEENKNKKYQEEVPIYVKKWITFKELVIVLRANLQEIVNRWAEGKGPLAMEFSSSEMKSLIRALFQNTERRAIALTKIK